MPLESGADTAWTTAQPCDQSSADGLLDLLLQATGASAGMLLEACEDSWEVLAGQGLTIAAAAAYRHRWRDEDPWLACLRRKPGASFVIAGERLLSPVLLRRSGFWAEWLQPNGFGSALLGVLEAPGGERRVLYLLRPARAGAQAKAIAALGSVVLALNQALAPEADAFLRAWLADVRLPVMLLRPDRTVMWSNRAAERLWAESGPLRLQTRRLVARAARVEPDFTSALAEAWTRPAVCAFGRDGTVRHLVMAPIRLASGAAALVLVGDAEDGALPSCEFLSKALGLTRVQAELAHHLCAGLSTEEIVARTRMNVHTLRAHLTTLFQLRGVSHRAELVAAILQQLTPLLALQPLSRPIPMKVTVTSLPTQPPLRPGLGIAPAQHFRVGQ
jgi:DNA-binding CsgD family transcriptional regulator/PAS domain-containing protein